MAFAPKRVLVPVDVDPMADRTLAERLVDDACTFAKLAHAELVLLHVALPLISHMSSPPDLVSEAYRSMLEVAEAKKAACARTLEELSRRAAKNGVTASVLTSERAGSVAESISDIARQERADLIMMTTHGRRGVKRFLLGSVAERTAHLAHIPVLLLPPDAS
jgi:nucleotide-binding universal stress UspA family protein